MTPDPSPEITPAPDKAPQGHSAPRPCPLGFRHYRCDCEPVKENPVPEPTLRSQLVEALVEHARRESQKREVKISRYLEMVIQAGAESRADAVLPVVVAALARARASCCEDGERTYGEMERHLTERAEQVEERLAHRHGEWQRELDARITAEQQLQDATRRAEKAEAAIARVRRLCELTINASIRLQAIDQARDTLTVLDQPEATP